MKRLLDLPAADHLTERAHTLVRALGATVESEERMLRVRRRLDAPSIPRAPSWRLRLALAAALLAASAVAAAGSGVLAAAFGANEPAAGLVDTASLPPRASERMAPRRVVPKGDLDMEAAAAEAAPAPAPAPRPVGPRATTLAPSSDVARVHEAATALRRDGDAARALRLLEAKPIRGPLAEEALALRIEASIARADGGQARLATAYLEQYPQGRYRELAGKALAGKTK